MFQKVPLATYARCGGIFNIKESSSKFVIGSDSTELWPWVCGPICFGPPCMCVCVCVCVDIIFCRFLTHDQAVRVCGKISVSNRSAVGRLRVCIDTAYDTVGSTRGRRRCKRQRWCALVPCNMPLLFATHAVGHSARNSHLHSTIVVTL